MTFWLAHWRAGGAAAARARCEPVHHVRAMGLARASARPAFGRFVAAPAPFPSAGLEKSPAFTVNRVFGLI